MVIQKQRIPINFSKGIDTKTDNKQLPVGSFLALENCVFDKVGRISKRNGFGALSRTIDGSGNSVQSGSALATFQDELLLFDNTDVYSYVSQNDKWMDVGSFTHMTAEETPIITDAYIKMRHSMAVVNNLAFIAYQDYDYVSGNRGVKYSVKNITTGATVVNNATIDASGIAPRVVSVNDIIYIVYGNTTTLYCVYINPVNPTIVSSPVVLSTDFKNTVPSYDAIAQANKLCVVFNSDTSAQIKMVTYDGTTVVDGWTSAITAGNGTANNGLSAYAYSTTGVSVALTNTAGNGITTNLVFDVSTPGAFINNVTSLTEGSLAPTAICHYYDSNGYITLFTNLSTVYTVRIMVNGAASSIVVQNASIASNIANIDGKLYVILHYKSNYQPTYFLCELTVNYTTNTATVRVVSKANVGSAFGLHSDVIYTYESFQPELLYSGSKLYSIQSYITNGTVASQKAPGLNIVSFDASQLRSCKFVEINNNLTIVGGCVKSYDGRSVVEHNFHLYPEIVSAVSAGGGSLSLGSYSYVVCYEWNDNNGQIHRSTPSVPATVSAALNDKVTLTITSLKLTEKSDVRLVVYRTKVNGSIYYRTSSVVSPTINNTGTASYYQTIVDSNSDATIASNEYVYTTGNVLDNWSPPSAKYICTHKGRIFLAGTTNPNEILFSKLSVDGEPTDFAAENSIIVDSAGGPITGLASNGQFLLIFKESAIFALAGDGPVNTGEQNDYNLPEQISYDIGAVSDNAIANTPEGIFFKSKKGIYTYNGSLSYIGAPVEDYNDYTVNSVVLVSDKNEVRFTTNEGITLVYNYFFKQWSTFTNQQSVDSVYSDSSFYFLNSNGTVFQESTGFSDNGEKIKLKIVTGWLSFAGISNYQRFKKLFILGEYKSPHYLNVYFGYDFNDNFVYNQVIRATDVFADGYVYGSGSYGSESPYGGDGYVYHLECNSPVQKCSSVRIKIEESQDGSYIGESFNLSQLNIEVGVKNSAYKAPPAQRF